ncbi:MAG: hypothetical protein ABDH91_02220 [Bacteroidia bacterium]
MRPHWLLRFSLSPLLFLYGQATYSLPFVAQRLAVDALHNLYIWAPAERALYKFWAPAYDSVIRVGGVPGTEGFLEASSLSPVGNQQLYLLDAAAQKICLLGTNLQPLQELSYADLPEEVQPYYPALLAAGSATELYLLLRETQEVVKIDPFGRVLLRFGGKVYGPGRIQGAAHLHAEGEKVTVVDTAARRILFYDRWGNFLESWPFPPEATMGKAFSEGGAFWRETQIWWQTPEGISHYTAPASIQDVWVRGKRLYWLAQGQWGWLPLP